MLNPPKLLSLDWDYVTGDCSVETNYDAHPHCGFCKGEKITRGRGHKKHLDTIWEEKEARLLSLAIHKDTPIFIAECHANIMDIAVLFEEFPEVFDYDAHHDAYDNMYRLHCGNWINHLKKLGGSVSSRPRTIPRVGAIFVCKSSPWTPRCMDEVFCQFIRKLSKKTQTEPKFIGHKKVSLRNEYRRTNA